jgi:hypothetical protein
MLVVVFFKLYIGIVIVILSEWHVRGPILKTINPSKVISVVLMGDSSLDNTKSYGRTKGGPNELLIIMHYEANIKVNYL